MRELVILACGECKRRNYTTTKDRNVQLVSAIREGGWAVGAGVVSKIIE
jgi:hypothetical protein